MMISLLASRVEQCASAPRKCFAAERAEALVGWPRRDVAAAQPSDDSRKGRAFSRWAHYRRPTVNETKHSENTQLVETEIISSLFVFFFTPPAAATEIDAPLAPSARL